MKYAVHVISDAENDLFEIYDYITKAGYPQNAEKIFSEIETACQNLSFNPEKATIHRSFNELTYLSKGSAHARISVRRFR